MWTIIAILLILWILGFFTKTLGALIHILLVVAVILVIVRLATGKKIV